MYQDMYDTITRLKLWDWLAKPDVPGEGGFMFSKNPNVGLITKSMGYQYHSGASFGFTLRLMEAIAKRGWDDYVNDLLSTPTCKCRYAKNLRGWCGRAGFGVPPCEQ